MTFALVLATLLFRTTFDGYNTAPEVAVNREMRPGGIEPELQLRMNADVAGPKRGNSLALTTPECVIYPLPGNMRPDRGTVSFWVKPCNYTFADARKFQILFEAKASDFELYVYKYFSRSNELCFYLAIGSEKNSVRGRANWREDEWHLVAVTWDSGGMALYIDGRIAEGMAGASNAPNTEFATPMGFPKAAKDGFLALNYHSGWAYVENGRLTAYDTLEIHDRRLSAKEIFEAFAKVFPERAQGPDVIAPAPRPPTVLYRCLPDDKKLVVRLQDRDDVLPGDMTNALARLSLTKKADGQLVRTGEAVFRTREDEVEFVFGDSLEENSEYQLKVDLPTAGQTLSTPFRVPDLSFLRERIAVDETVPPPWHPIRACGKNTFAALGRTYSFGDGPFPVQIAADDENLLVEAPVLVVGGEKVRWSSVHVTETHGDRVVLASEGTCGRLRFSGKTELWFDGFCRISFAMSPADGAVEVPGLTLKWATPRTFARYLLTPLARKWTADRFDDEFGVGGHDASMLWTVGIRKGVAWWGESDANWIRKGKNLHAVREGDRATLSVDLIARPVRLAGRATYAMGFQGTPSRTPDRLYRRLNYGSIEGANFRSCGWSSASGRHAGDSIRHWTSLSPNFPEEFGPYLDRELKKGRRCVIYSMPAHLSPLDEPWDYFSAVWLKHPGIRWEFKDATTGVRASTVPCCGHTGAADWQLRNARDTLRRYPQLAGLYFDVSTAEDCDNVLHGDGGTDVFGRKYVSSTACHLRTFFLRMLKLCRAENRMLHIHAHNLFFPFVHAFADVFWPGEEQYHRYVANPKWHYQEGITDEEYQSAWNCDIRGTGIFFIPQNARAKSLQPALVGKDPEAYLGRDAVFGAVLPSLVYDFRCMGELSGCGEPLTETWRALDPLGMDKAVFHGFWYDPAAGVADGLRTALYTWKPGTGLKPFLLVVGNFAREDRETGLAVDWNRIGAAPCRLKDLLSGMTRAESEWRTHVLRAHNYLLLVPENKINERNMK